MVVYHDSITVENVIKLIYRKIKALDNGLFIFVLLETFTYSYGRTFC